MPLKDVFEAKFVPVVQEHAKTLTTIMATTSRFLDFHIARLMADQEELPMLDRSILDAIMVMVQDPAEEVPAPRAAVRWSGNTDEKFREKQESADARILQHQQLQDSLAAVMREAPAFLANPLSLGEHTYHLRQEVADQYLTNLRTSLVHRLSPTLHKLCLSWLRWEIFVQGAQKPPTPQLKYVFLFLVLLWLLVIDSLFLPLFPLFFFSCFGQ